MSHNNLFKSIEISNISAYKMEADECSRKSLANYTEADFNSITYAISFCNGVYILIATDNEKQLAKKFIISH